MHRRARLLPAIEPDATLRSSSLERRHAFVVMEVEVVPARCRAAGPAVPARRALAQQPIALPGITVQGATLEAPPPQRRIAPPPAASARLRQAAPAASRWRAGRRRRRSRRHRRQRRDGGHGRGVARASRCAHAADALRSLPGVSVSRSGGFGNLTQVRIRGAEGNHTLVLIDGIEANNIADGEFDFSNLSAEDIERIEVIRGPMSGLYGSNAVGGVINIITRDGEGPLTVTVRTRGRLVRHPRRGGARVRRQRQGARRRSPTHWRDTDGFNISPVGGENDGSRTRHASPCAAGPRCCRRHARFHRAPHREDADRDGFGGAVPAPWRRPSTIARRYDNGVAGRRQSALGHARRTRSRRSSAPTTTARSRRHRSARSSAAASNISESGARSPISPPTASTCRRLGVTQHVLRPRREGGRALHARGRPSPTDWQRQRGRIAYTGEWRGGFADRLFLTAGVRRDDNDNFQDFTTWRTAGLAGAARARHAAARQRRHGREAAHHVRAVRHRSRSSCPTPT